MGGIESGIGPGAKANCAYSCWTFARLRVNGTALNKQSYQTTMKNGLKLALAFGFGMALLQVNAAAQNMPPSMNSPTNAPKLSPKEQKENMSYSHRHEHRQQHQGRRRRTGRGHHGRRDRRTCWRAAI